MIQGKAMQIVDMSNPNADKITSASTTNAVISNKQDMTAVEWLYDHLFPSKLDGFSDEEWSKIDEAFKQARQMEKKQIIKASEDTYKNTCEYYRNGAMDNDAILFGEQYYNETYGQ